MRFFVGNCIIAAFLGIFVYISFQQYQATLDIGYLLIAVNESVYAGLFLVRTRAVATSQSKYDWSIAFLATFVSTLLRPADPLSVALGDTLIAIGTVANIAAAFNLGTSIGIVPAEREIRTNGMYRYVRHPMYASEVVSLVGYIISNISIANITIAIVNVILLTMRIDREEAFLARSATYREYLGRVRWKLVMFVY